MRRVKNEPAIRDEHGGFLCLRGVNVSGDAKARSDLLPPYGEADFARLRDEIGANAIRLLVFWEAIEPEPGRYDARYLAAVRERVDAAGRAGLRVLIDMHQDLWGRGFGSAGAPLWAGDPHDYDGYRPSRPWMLGYFRPEVARAFDRLWSDEALQESFARAWAEVVHAVASARSVIGYDLLNEPFFGSGDPDRFDRSIAPRFYARVVDAIRAIDPDRWIALEPASAAAAGYPSRFVPPRRAGLALAPHLYAPTVEVGLPWGSDRAILETLADRLVATARDAGLPLFIGELGARREVPGAERYLGDLLDVLDARRLGWFQWELGQSSYGWPVARPGPVRVAGDPIAWGWDGTRFEMSFEETGVPGETIVSVPTGVFPSGVDAELDDGGEVRCEGTRLYVPPRGGLRRLSARGRGAG